ncbi:hypothetical protein T4A_2215 [Trichinella pseudospiralis]|uniref:Uncharacterized protein n=1 Tax=Trichinella pseudospiralis TaxID=6337 RepID=A0A0V1E1P5_TRIPS|nr:hypothetical protein T4A_2215 [Trichinella pseudospiralis]
MKNFTRVANKHFGSTKEAVKEPTTRMEQRTSKTMNDMKQMADVTKQNRRKQSYQNNAKACFD